MNTVKEHNLFINNLQETQENRKCEGVIDGFNVSIEPFYTTHKHERAKVLINNDYFAQEWTTIPFSFLQEIKMSYWCWADFSNREDLLTIMEKMGISYFNIEEDPYAEPARYHVWLKNLEDVVILYKNLKDIASR